MASTVYLIAGLIFVIPFSIVVQMLNNDKVKKDIHEYGEREAERKALQQAQEFDKF